MGKPEPRKPKGKCMKRISQQLAAKLSLALRSAPVLIALQFGPLIKSADAAPKSNPSPQLNVEEAPLSRDVKAGTSFAPIIKKVAPSVVNIYSSMTIHERQESNPLLNDPFFRRFFGDDSGGRVQP